MTTSPWLKFYPADWQADQALRLCSLAARGLWVECMCIMHRAVPYGHLVVNGQSVTAAQLAVLAGTLPDQIPDLLGELETAGVFSRTRQGVVYSRRMTRDDKKARVARKNGKSGGNPKLCKTKAISASDKGGDKAQKPEARSQNNTAVADGGANERNPIREALDSIGAWDNPNTHLTGGRVVEWMRQGADLDLDILPTLKAVTERRRKRDGPQWLPNSMSFFDQAITDAVAARTRPLPEGNPNAKPAHAQPSRPSARRNGFLALIADEAGLGADPRPDDGGHRTGGPGLCGDGPAIDLDRADWRDA